MMRNKKITLALSLVAGSAVFLVAIFSLILYIQISRDLPSIYGVSDYHPLGVTTIYAQDGPLGEFYKEKRSVVEWKDIPKPLIDAFLSAEDDEFFKHGGINFQAILRAGIANLLAGQVVQGGSTITQQLVKSLFLTPDRNIIRKIKEVILAYRLEKHLNKEQILYVYLNQIYLGNGAYGVGAASHSFFRKNLKDLSLAEIALLAAMPRAPSKFNPLTNPTRAKERQLYVLKRLAENKYITHEKAEEEGKKPLKIYFQVNEQALPAVQYYLEEVRKTAVLKYGEKAIYEEGLTIKTPAYIRILKAAHMSLLRGLSEVEKRKPYSGPHRKIELAEDRAKFQIDKEEEFFKRRFDYMVLTEEGEITRPNVTTDPTSKKPEKYLQVGDLYEAMVELAPPGQKTMEALIGKIPVKVPWSEMVWTKAKSVSEILKPGDVIWVRVLKIQDKEGVTASLEPKLEIQGSSLTVDMKTGKVISLIGGIDFTKSEFNRAIQARRQAGSLIKPLIYSLAIERGYTPASILVDSPLVFDNEESGTWKPENYEEKFFGDTTLWQALVNSRNVPTVKLVQAMGIDSVRNYLKRFRFNGDLPQDLSISLGSAALTLEELVRSFSVIARKGRWLNLSYVDSVTDRNGKEVVPLQGLPTPIPTSTKGLDAPAVAKAFSGSDGNATPTAASVSYTPDASDPDQILDPRVAGVMVNLLRDVVLYGTASKARDFGRWIAGKTGTTNDFRDAWFIGFSPSVITGVWLGHDDLKTLGSGESGAGAALPIWLGTMREALEGRPVNETFETPPGVVFAQVHPKKGVLVEGKGSQGVLMPFLEGSEPTSEKPRGKTNTSVPTDSDFLREDLDE